MNNKKSSFSNILQNLNIPLSTSVKDIFLNDNIRPIILYQYGLTSYFNYYSGLDLFNLIEKIIGKTDGSQSILPISNNVVVNILYMNNINITFDGTSLMHFTDFLNEIVLYVQSFSKKILAFYVKNELNQIFRLYVEEIYYDYWLKLISNSIIPSNLNGLPDFKYQPTTETPKSNKDVIDMEVKLFVEKEILNKLPGSIPVNVPINVEVKNISSLNLNKSVIYIPTNVLNNVFGNTNINSLQEMARYMYLTDNQWISNHEVIRCGTIINLLNVWDTNAEPGRATIANFRKALNDAGLRGLLTNFDKQMGYN